MIFARPSIHTFCVYTFRFNAIAGARSLACILDIHQQIESIDVYIFFRDFGMFEAIAALLNVRATPATAVDRYCLSQSFQSNVSGDEIGFILAAPLSLAAAQHTKAHSTGSMPAIMCMGFSYFTLCHIVHILPLPGWRFWRIWLRSEFV